MNRKNREEISFHFFQFLEFNFEYFLGYFTQFSWKKPSSRPYPYKLPKFNLELSGKTNVN